eukprot:1726894-Pleurochrysis_carterae.AAC.2
MLSRPCCTVTLRASRVQFYIAGESYAGVYVPTLAQEVLDHAPTIKLRGVYVGDPCTDNAAQADSMDMLWYAHKYGLVPDSDFDLLWNTCARNRCARCALPWHTRPSTYACTRIGLCASHVNHVHIARTHAKL